jgi:hypothetical protein
MVIRRSMIQPHDVINLCEVGLWLIKTTLKPGRDANREPAEFAQPDRAER